VADYKVALDVYHGPLDLMLFLIQREEVDIYDIPISLITKEYIQYVEMLEILDPEIVGEFLILAATLMEIKSRLLLPTPPPEEVDEELIDPRLELVHQLLEYKKYKEAARSLEDSALEQALKHARSPVLPPRDTDEVELDNLEIWDLFDAFNSILEQTGKGKAVHHVPVDDTPIALHADDVIDVLQRANGTYEFSRIFSGRTRPEMIGLFLALLELIRQKRIIVKQATNTSDINIHLMDPTPLDEIEDLDAEYNQYAAKHDAESESDNDDAQPAPPQDSDVAVVTLPTNDDLAEQEKSPVNSLVEKTVERDFIELDQTQNTDGPTTSTPHQHAESDHQENGDNPSGELI